MTLITRFLCCASLAIAVNASAAEPEKPEDPDPSARLPLAELQLFAQVFEQIRSSYVEEIDDKTLLENAIIGLLAELDPHSSFLKAESFDEMQQQTTGEFGGIGIEVSMEGGYVKVISPIDDTPASRAGIMPGDLIIKLNEHAVQGMSLEDAIGIMRGKKGTSLALTIAREDSEGPINITLIRDQIVVKSVRHRLLEPGFAYIRIAQFQAQTGSELNKSLKQLISENEPLKGLVLDLRNNPGGLLSASVEVADAFIDKGLIVYTEGRSPTSRQQFSATPGDMLNGTPLVVLINGGTASASEIVAGAIQDHRRGIVMGTDSFGKGSVQTVLPLEDGRAIKLTTARYFTPNGRSIQALSIIPDILVERAEIRTIESNFEMREANLDKHLSSQTQPADKQSLHQSEPVTTDNQLYEALNLLKGLHILSEKKE
ncbi:MAG: S41 family peptidase [Porticoccaceae bacterium]|nr:S41 family peptidase [Porticoccaceae bacterium]